MKNILRLDRIIKEYDKVTYLYSVEGDFVKFFHPEEDFFVTYPFEINDIPEGVLVIPFLSNFLPIAWLCDADVIIPELDKTFWDELENIKSGYEEMYPMLKFKGNIVIENITDNRPQESKGSAVLFSGGVDAFTTLFRHIDENPFLVTLWGPDVDVNNSDAWEIVKAGIEKVSNDYGLKFLPVRTSIKKVIDDPLLCSLVSESGDGWYHGFQHGIAIISHMAPIAYKYKLATAYIASSYPASAKGTYTCASDPIIDNHMKYCGCITVHDGYELDRQQKVKYLVEEKNKRNSPVRLHVCWESQGGENCCSCEKCYRTILEIISEGADPNDFGFDWSRDKIIEMKKALKYKIRIPQSLTNSSYLITQNIMAHNADKISNIKDYDWFLKMDLSKMNDSFLKKLNNYRYKILRRRM